MLIFLLFVGLVSVMVKLLVLVLDDVVKVKVEEVKVKIVYVGKVDVYKFCLFMECVVVNYFKIVFIVGKMVKLV